MILTRCNRWPTCDSCVLVVEGLVEHQLFRLPNRFQYKRLAVITPVSAHPEADLARVRVLVEGLCDRIQMRELSHPSI